MILIGINVIGLLQESGKCFGGFSYGWSVNVLNVQFVTFSLTDFFAYSKVKKPRMLNITII
ncbi:hypothetical protein MTO98_05625 [Mucilaginibacter sp. SMC90]|uniref:hypothetical protein n=1 Tax=Mucilaginibacter sp. SMC90 TaxID=2929803 RepID=UPI001FB4483A|nr:hypothetical protein [Mucilaginibacter sp. SMC90]UOE50552.1 hypothetical protein MTO98_05625 [Mucilaginibacter sp. SMC90]